jgi:hypothetical protein
MLKPPVIICSDFLTPLKCQSEQVLEYTALKINTIVGIVERHYGVKIIDAVAPMFGSVLSSPVCDNSTYKNRRWVRTTNYDFTGYIPLVSYNNDVPFDPTTDVYGGELLFKTLKFKHAPITGELLIFPSAPNFLHYHDTVKIGNLKYIKFHLICDKPYQYDYSKFNCICSTWQF